MNRHDRRKSQKLSRDATPDEIFPDGRHAPIQPEIHELMNKVAGALKDTFGPNYDITLFVAERTPPAGVDRLPRFNYISTAERPDMLAVLKAFIEKNEATAAKVDKIADEPPTSTPQ